MAVSAGLSIAQAINGTRKASIRSRLKECGGLGGWDAALEKIKTNSFFHGDNDRGWKAGLLQADLLRVYRATGGASRKTLAAMLGVKPQSLSGALIKLQALGLIPRERLPYPPYQKR